MQQSQLAGAPAVAVQDPARDVLQLQVQPLRGTIDQPPEWKLMLDAVLAVFVQHCVLC